MIWIIAVAAGLGASWLLDAAKPWVRIDLRKKAFVFFLLTAALWVVTVVLLPQPWPPASSLIASGLLALAIGKTAHAFNSALQAVKDSHRVKVMTSRQR